MGRIRTVLLVLALLAVSLAAAPAAPAAPVASAAGASSPQAKPAPRPALRSVSPAVGSVKGGVTVTLRGNGFRRVQAVSFGTTRGTRVKVLSPMRLTVRVPAHKAGAVRVSVRTNTGVSADKVFYTFLRAPAIRSTTPPVAKPGQAYRFAFSVVDVRRGTWRLDAGALPAGLRLSSAGVVSGTPTSAATSASATVRFTDTARGTTTRRFRIAVLSPLTYTAVERGEIHACALGVDRSLWCWGWNFAGQLGDGTLETRATRIQVGSSTNWATLTTGYFSTCATRTDGTAWCWGSGGAGQLGDGRQTDSTRPVQVGFDTDWTRLDGGGSHTCGLTTDGTAWCWGSDEVGQLGTTTGTSAVPVPVGSDTDWASISAGSSDTCAVKLDATLWCWGGNQHGEHGDGSTESHPTPVQVGSGAVWATVSVGSEHVCATRTDGTAWCWGGNKNGVLGNGTSDGTSVSPPTQVGTATTWRSIVASDFNTCATQTDGEAYCWGADGAGQLGDGVRGFDSATPSLVVSGRSWTSVSVAFDTTCGLTTGGDAFCWGNGQDGRRGDGRDEPFLAVPSRVL